MSVLRMPYSLQPHTLCLANKTSNINSVHLLVIDFRIRLNIANKMWRKKNKAKYAINIINWIDRRTDMCEFLLLIFFLVVLVVVVIALELFSQFPTKIESLYTIFTIELIAIILLNMIVKINQNVEGYQILRLTLL